MPGLGVGVRPTRSLANVPPGRMKENDPSGMSPSCRSRLTQFFAFVLVPKNRTLGRPSPKAATTWSSACRGSPPPTPPRSPCPPAWRPLSASGSRAGPAPAEPRRPLPSEPCKSEHRGLEATKYLEEKQSAFRIGCVLWMGPLCPSAELSHTSLSLSWTRVAPLGSPVEN